MILYHYF